MEKIILMVLIIVNSLSTSVVHLPLDERFTTRVAFLNMATMTPFNIISQPESLLPSLKKSQKVNLICDWFINASYKE